MVLSVFHTRLIRLNKVNSSVSTCLHYTAKDYFMHFYLQSDRENYYFLFVFWSPNYPSLKMEVYKSEVKYKLCNPGVLGKSEKIFKNKLQNIKN